MTRSIYKIGTGADILRFDVSDLMHPSVGVGAFWEGIVDWVSGREDLDTVLRRIDASWP